MLRIAILSAAVLGACTSNEAQPRKLLVVDEHNSDVVAVGVLPEKFECESVAPRAEVEKIVGAFERTRSQFDTPDGLPSPCMYWVAGDAGGAQWSFDIDCRGKAISDGRALMVQYASASDTRPVHVGKSGIDYRGTALLFIDDDVPCYGRIIGPEHGGRLALARLVAKNLDETTAPTSLRFQRGGKGDRTDER